MHYKNLGFTLLEVLITLTIVIAVSTFGFIFSLYWLEQHQIKQISYDIQQAVSRARQEASFRHNSVTLQPTTENNWSCGISLLETSTKQVIREWGWGSKGIGVQWQGFQSRKFLKFMPNLQHNAINGTFVLTGRLAQESFTINRMGNIRPVTLPHG